MDTIDEYYEDDEEVEVGVGAPVQVRRSRGSKYFDRGKITWLYKDGTVRVQTDDYIRYNVPLKDVRAICSDVEEEDEEEEEEEEEEDEEDAKEVEPDPIRLLASPCAKMQGDGVVKGTVCAVCLGEEDEDDDPLVRCSRCSLLVHQTCYGGENGLSVGRKQKWTCDACNRA